MGRLEGVWGEGEMGVSEGVVLGVGVWGQAKWDDVVEDSQVPVSRAWKSRRRPKRLVTRASATRAASAMRMQPLADVVAGVSGGVQVKG